MRSRKNQRSLSWSRRRRRRKEVDYEEEGGRRLILCIIAFSSSSALCIATSWIVITSTAGRWIALKFDNSVGETPTNLSDLGFKIGEAGVEVIGGGENGVGGGNKGLEVSEYAGFK